MSLRHFSSVAVVLTAFVLASGRGEAHKPITSPYTYTDDVFPILRDRCGRCHVTGGVAPMSLMTYKETFPWGESIRTELVAGHMPPWTVEEAAGKFRNAQPLSARDLNVLLTWATGGNPIGNIDATLPAVEVKRDWRLGPPDLVLPWPSESTISAEQTEQTREFTLPTGTTESRWVRAADLLPGNPAIVRSATISVAQPGSGVTGAIRAEQILAVWIPGDDPIPLEGGAAFRLPAGANLVVRVHYKKTWENERLAMSDRSAIGLYYAPAATTELRAVTLSVAQDSTPSPPKTAAIASPGDQRFSFGTVVEQDLQAVAIYPDPALARARVEVTAVRPDGSRTEMIRFRPQPDWARRYWFTEPVPLPKGTRLTVVMDFDEALLPPGAAPIKTTRPDPSSLALTLNVVARP